MWKFSVLLAFLLRFGEIYGQRMPAENKAETVRHLLESYENIPDAVFDLSQSSGKPSRSSLKFPTLYDIHISNKMYQVSETEVCTILIKTCHLDEREPTGPVVRCVTSVEFKAEFHAEHFASKRYEPFYTKFNEAIGVQAVFWDTKSRKVAGKSNMTSIMTFVSIMVSPETPIVFTFPLPEGVERKYLAVSLIDRNQKRGKVTNFVKVKLPENSVHKVQEGGIALCMKNVFQAFRDNSINFAEWIEIQKAMGSEHLFVPILGDFQHPNVSKLLKYYEKQGVLTVQRSNLYGRRSHPTGVIRLGYPATKTESDMHKVQVDLEKLNLNTCVLNSIGKYRFVFVVDNDEFYSINIPGIFTWQEVRKNAFLKGTPKTTTCFPELQMIQSNEAVQFARDNHLIKVCSSSS
ncbi:unnamed protein product [Notodromas monacha]|uniref:Glycosyltransferase family 92 protein n=1 Tax=Notodromas monacha TaxID=399045 RepID=A0A7R9BIX0_9CRUS|nr:unnamed protein product [Notodromas monacha]CAG0916373.1 unnamed protein product [Notodromas monacha]